MTRPALALVVALAGGPVQDAGPSAESAAEHHRRAVQYHERRSLDEASREYARTLELEPPRDATRDELERARRFAPRLFTTPTEVFPLKDFAVILHPGRRLIAYHFFWEDDIDFPEDNDPCDHELMWVEYSADGRSLERIWTYFHRRLLAGGEAALRDARAHGMRPRVNVQWGKHGSMPADWEALPFVPDEGDIERDDLQVGARITLRDYNMATFRKLSTEGRRLVAHPLARRLAWPDRFVGGWERFVDFSRAVEPLDLLARTKMIKVSRWNNATIDQHFLSYNFRPKTEWPVEDLPSRASPLAGVRSLEAFQLPPKSVFDPAMPRYPNVWFYLDAALAPSHDAAVRFVTGRLREAMRLREHFGPFDNPEGCDFETRLEHLQPWEASAARALQHAHAFHMRYYYSALARQKLERVDIKTAGGDRPFYRFAASVHYEVEHSNPNHADVESCPICGRTGEYAQLRGNLVELVHDPLGLELLLKGTIRGEAVRVEEYDRREVGSVAALSRELLLEQFVFPGAAGDRNTLRIGVVVLSPR